MEAGNQAIDPGGTQGQTTSSAYPGPDSENVKRWRGGTMALRWCAAGMGEATKQFRRVNGHLHLSKLRDTLNAQIAETVNAARQDDDRKVA